MGAVVFVLLWALTCLPAVAAGLDWKEPAASRPIQASDWETLRGYGDRAARAWLKEVAGFDLNTLGLTLGSGGLLENRGVSRMDAASVLAPTSPGVLGGGTGALRLRLEQYDDLLRLLRDLRDIPFGVVVDAELELARGVELLKTSLWLPLSWKDEWRAQASLPVALGTGPLRRVLTLNSGVRGRLGQNQFDAGVGTVLQTGGWGLWNVDYDFNQRFGQGAEESIHWLRFSKMF
jgi:hypothetical protein